MKKLITLLIISFILSSCSFFRPHRMDVEQGNIYTQDQVRRLHPGMSEAQVKNIMGDPVLTNVLTTHEIAYVYTNQPGYGDFIQKRVVCIFQYGTLREVRY